MKLLIADDSAIMRQRIANVVSDFKNIKIVDQAQDVAKAIRGIVKYKPDVVILDIRMLGGSGIDVLKRTQKKKDYGTVIVLTNYPFPEYREKCFELGADYFLDKATEFEDISEILSDLLHGPLQQGDLSES